MPGKLIHDEWEDCSLVDYNRSGVPLIEIVSEPDMRSSEEVIAYLEKLRCTMQYLGVLTVSSRRAPCVPMSTFPSVRWEVRPSGNKNRDEEPELL